MSKIFFTSSSILLLLLLLSFFSNSHNVDAAAVVTPYNASAATRAWFFCKLNACDPTQIMNGFTCPVCKDIQNLYGDSLVDVNVFYHEQAKAHGWVGYSPQKNQIIVSFRGTRTVQWFYDFDFKFVPLPGCTLGACYIHAGFWEVYQILQPNITLHVTKLLNQFSSAQVHVVGHSLGGALAAASAYQLLYQLKAPVASLITFGQPRVWSYNASIWVSQLMISAGTQFNRLIWRHDPVVALPMPSLGYWHASTGGSQIWYPHNSTVGWIQANDGPGFEDFSPNNYFVNVPLQDSDPNDHNYYMLIEHGCS